MKGRGEPLPWRRARTSSSRNPLRRDLVATSARRAPTTTAAPSSSTRDARENLVKPILDRFAEETGIDVEVRYGDTSDLALLIEEEGDQSPADVFLSQSPGAVGYLDRPGLLGTLPEDVLDLVPEQFHAGDGSWVGFSGRKRVLAFNPEIVPEDELPRACST